MSGVGLRARLLGAVLLVLSVLLTVIATLVVLRAEQGLVDARREQAETSVRQLSESIQYAVLARSDALLGPALDAFVTTPDLLRVRVLDEGGAPLAERTTQEKAAVAMVVEVPVRTRAAPPGEDPGDLEAMLPASGEPRLVGKIAADFSDGSLEVIKRRMRRDMLLAFVLLGGLGLLGVFMMASSVVRRVRRLAAAAARVSRGELDVTVDPVGGDELGELTRDFNAMTLSLREQRRALDEAAATLADREALAAIGRATAVIAHELRNPLGILLGAAQIAANPARPEDAREKAARMMEEEVRRLERTLTDLLSYARPKPPEKAGFQLLAQCRHAAERAAIQGGPAEALKLDVSGTEIVVQADEQHLGQVLLNLFINAAQAGATHVEVRVEQVGPRAWVHVSDDGTGVNADIREQLFRPFVTTKQRGAGLGLSGSRRLMRDNGGDLRLVDSDKGAHFVVELPLAAEGA